LYHFSFSLSACTAAGGCSNSSSARLTSASTDGTPFAIHQCQLHLEQVAVMIQSQPHIEDVAVEAKAVIGERAGCGRTSKHPLKYLDK